MAASEQYQTLKDSARATSKFKVLQPTKLEDLIKYVPGRYKAIPSSELDGLSKDDVVQIAFINNEDLWISVDSVDTHENKEGLGTVYGKTTHPALKLHGLQKGQRVCFDLRCVCGIRYHDDSDEDDED